MDGDAEAARRLAPLALMLAPATAIAAATLAAPAAQAFIHSDQTIRIRTLGGRRVARVVPTWRELGSVELNRAGSRLLYTYFDPFNRKSVCRLRVGARRPTCFRSTRDFHAWGPGGTIVSIDEDVWTDI